MGKKDKIQAKIDIIKALLLSFMAALFGIFGYVVTQNEQLTAFRIVCVVIGVLFLVAAILLCGRTLKAELDKLEKEP
ncbi:MAG: hypothetical protein K2M51_00760 [Helicobacter sp.]|nr:hypothetical protein [Helicobacter sp.]